MDTDSTKKTAAKSATAGTKSAAAPAKVKSAGSHTKKASAAPRKAPVTKSEAVASAEKVAKTPVLVTSAAPQNMAPELKKKDLIDLVTERSGVKKNAVKPVVEALLAVLGEEMAKGRDLNLAPMGKLKVTRIKQMASGRIVICKLRQSDAASDAEKAAKDPLADAAE